MNNNDHLRHRSALMPDYEKRGPTMLDLEVIQFCTDDEFIHRPGLQYFEHLRETGLLAQCLGVREADEILVHDNIVPAYWRARKKIHLWKSVSVHTADQSIIWVPYLKFEVLNPPGTEWEIDWQPLPPLTEPAENQPLFPNLALIPIALCGLVGFP